jgi:hypothetical protein
MWEWRGGPGPVGFIWWRQEAEQRGVRGSVLGGRKSEPSLQLGSSCFVKWEVGVLPWWVDADPLCWEYSSFCSPAQLWSGC